jgi:DNA repair protein RAD50
MQNASTGERVKAHAMEYSEAETFFQQLDKLRTVYDDYMKLVEETIPLAEKNLNQRLADQSQKEQTFDDVSFLLLTPSAFNFCTQNLRQESKMT